MRRQAEVELLDQHLLIDVELGIARQNQSTAISGREVDIEHLDGGQLVQHGPGGQSGCQGLKPGPQSYMKAISEEGDEDVSFDASLELMVNRA